MEDHDRFDDELTKVVRSVELDVPPAVENRLRVVAESPRPSRGKRPIRRPLLFIALPSAMIVVLAVLLVFQPVRGRKDPQIAEIRTEFILADKDIMIVFIQRPDFPVLVTPF
jgi:hypothetical protein